MREENKTHVYTNACVLIYMELDISSHKTSLMNNVKIRISLFMVFINLNNIVYVLLKIWLSRCIRVFFLPVRLPCMEVYLEARKRCVTTVTDNYQVPCRCWEGNQGPLEEWPVLFKHSPRVCVLNNTKVVMQLQTYDNSQIVHMER